MTTYTDLCKDSLLSDRIDITESRNSVLDTTFRLLGTWYERSRQRAALKEMDDHMLADIGVSKNEMEAESAKPFWKA